MTKVKIKYVSLLFELPKLGSNIFYYTEGDDKIEIRKMEYNGNLVGKLGVPFEHIYWAYVPEFDHGIVTTIKVGDIVHYPTERDRRKVLAVFHCLEGHKWLVIQHTESLYEPEVVWWDKGA